MKNFNIFLFCKKKKKEIDICTIYLSNKYIIVRLGEHLRKEHSSRYGSNFSLPCSPCLHKGNQAAILIVQVKLYLLHHPPFSQLPSKQSPVGQYTDDGFAAQACRSGHP